MLLRDILPDKQDKEMQNDFSATLARCMKLLKANGMQPLWPIPELGELILIRKKTGVKARFRLSVTINKLSENQVQVSIPAFIPTRSINAPAHTKRVDIHICAASSQLPDGQGLGEGRLFTTSAL